MHYSLKDLHGIKTLSKSHFEDLKVETETERVWLSRCTTEDGEEFNNKVIVEKPINGYWEVTEIYQAI